MSQLTRGVVSPAPTTALNPYEGSVTSRSSIFTEWEPPVFRPPTTYPLYTSLPFMLNSAELSSVGGRTPFCF